MDFRLWVLTRRGIVLGESRAKHLVGLFAEQGIQSLLIGRLEFVEREIRHVLNTVLLSDPPDRSVVLEKASTPEESGA